MQGCTVQGHCGAFSAGTGKHICGGPMLPILQQHHRQHSQALSALCCRLIKDMHQTCNNILVVTMLVQSGQEVEPQQMCLAYTS